MPLPLATWPRKSPPCRNWRVTSCQRLTSHEYTPLLDSADMTPDDWGKIACDIATHDEPYYDGFIVLHGTDTMAYTVSALPFMLQGLRKPVVLTGSQIPLCAPSVKTKLRPSSRPARYLLKRSERLPKS